MALRMWGQLIVQATMPAEDPVMVGTLWADTSADQLKQCTSISPYTFVTIGGTGATLGAHATQHQNGGSDEISVAGLSGLLADSQTPIPAGSDGQVQYNNGGVQAGSAHHVWDDTFNVLRVGVADSGAGDIIANGTYFKFHGNKQHEILVENSLGSASLVVTGGGNAASFLDLRSTYGTGSSDYIRLATGSNGSNEGLRVISSGKVGINTSTPAAQLSVNGGAHIGGTTDPGDNNLLVDGTATVDGHLILTTPGVIRTSTSDGSDNGAINITGGGAFGSSRGAGFSVGGNEDASIPGSVQYTLGNVANAFLSIVSPVGAGSIFYDGDTGHTAIDSLHVGGASDPGDNNLLVDGIITVTGGQIVFPATQAASAGANTLDDYEEGTWTPVIGGDGGTSGQTYTTQVGAYIKVGQLVAAGFDVTLSAKGTITGNVQIQGLPFASSSATAQVSGVLWIGLSTTWVDIMTILLASSSSAYVLGALIAATRNDTLLTTTDITDATTFRATIVYRTGA